MLYCIMEDTAMPTSIKKNIYNYSIDLSKIKRINMSMSMELFKKAKEAQLIILKKEGKSIGFGKLMRTALEEYIKNHNL